MSYATLAQIKAYLNITVTDDDVLLSRLLDAATRAIETHTQRRFRSVSEQRVVRTSRTAFLFLRDDITQLIELHDMHDTAIDATNVHALNDMYPTRVLVRYPTWPVPLKVTARWGYSDVPPDDIVHICIRLAAYFYRQKDAQTFDTVGQPSLGIVTLPSGVPADVKQLLDRYRVREVVL